MQEKKKQDRARTRRLRYAEGKLRAARLQLARAERSILYWSRILADLRHERTRAVQHPLWPDEEAKENS